MARACALSRRSIGWRTIRRNWQQCLASSKPCAPNSTAAPLVVALTLFVWICTILLYCTGMVLGLAAFVVALLGVAVLLTYSLQNGIILLVIAFLISPMGLPTAAAWLLGKVQGRTDLA